MVCPLGQKSSFKTCPAYNLKSFWDRVNLKIYGGGDHDFYIHGFEVGTKFCSSGAHGSSLLFLGLPLNFTTLITGSLFGVYYSVVSVSSLLYFQAHP